ncbi:MAG: biotin-dependent carboxyltransferase family protein [Gammaproteobacteria bacterium]|nr:biotin-dependent carboxyltransferase family protein [Gammaproteobacteria bacterium]
MSIRFVKAGLLTTVQDSGRFGLADKGISSNGAMDSIAMQTANWLVSRPLTSPVIEITLAGPTVKFDQSMSFAVSGANFDLILNDSPIPANQTIHVNQGDKLQFGKCLSGLRAYLAFSGRIKLPKTLDSYSTHLMAEFGGFNGRALQDDDVIELADIQIPPRKILPNQYKPFYGGNYQIRITDSVESSEFSAEQMSQFLNQTYHVMPQSNRMGLRLQCDDPVIINKSILSSGLAQGSIQIPPSGQPVISSVDGQTIGGYPRIANVISADWPILAQLKAKDKITFAYVSIEQAMQIRKEKMGMYKQLWG